MCSAITRRTRLVCDDLVRDAVVAGGQAEGRARARAARRGRAGWGTVRAPVAGVPAGAALVRAALPEAIAASTSRLADPPVAAGALDGRQVDAMLVAAIRRATGDAGGAGAPAPAPGRLAREHAQHRLGRRLRIEPPERVPPRRGALRQADGVELRAQRRRRAVRI